MSPLESIRALPPSSDDPVLFAYNGSDLAAFAIKQAGFHLSTDRPAIVACVWRPVDVTFNSNVCRVFRPAIGAEVRWAAEETAAHGALLAEEAGFSACSRTISVAPTWKGLIDLAHRHDCGMIVLGTHRRSSVLSRLAGSVAAATVSHFDGSVLVVHKSTSGAGRTSRHR